MRLGWNIPDRVYVFDCTMDENIIAKAAHFRWNPSRRYWWTQWAKTAEILRQYADADCVERLDREKAKRIEKQKDRDKTGAQKRDEKEIGRGPWMGRNAKPGSPF